MIVLAGHIQRGLYTTRMRHVFGRRAWHFAHRFSSQRRFVASSAFSIVPSSWYYAIQNAKDRAKVLHFRDEDFPNLDAEELETLGRRWIQNNDSVRVEVVKDNCRLAVRPLWVSIRANSNGTSHLYVSILRVGEHDEQVVMEYSEPQVKKCTFNAVPSTGNFRRSSMKHGRSLTPMHILENGDATLLVWLAS